MYMILQTTLILFLPSLQLEDNKQKGQKNVNPPFKPMISQFSLFTPTTVLLQHKCFEIKNSIKAICFCQQHQTIFQDNPLSQVSNIVMKYNYLQMTFIQVSLLLALVVISHSAAAASSAKDKLKILTISDNPQNVATPVYSSAWGGKVIYINLLGHTMVASDISVTVGNYPCKINSDGVNTDFIVCTTTNCTDSSDYNKALLVTVTVASKKQVDVTKNPFIVYYYPSATPKTTEIIPSSNYAGQTTAVEGVHKSSDVGSGESTGGTKIKLGDSVGDRTNVTQESINGNSASQKINVKQNQDNEGGKKLVTQTNKQYGNSDTSALKKATLEDDQEFHYTTLPAITNVTNKGSEDGHQIEIKGSGFSADHKKNNVTVDGQTCKIKQSSSNKIKCTLDKKDDDSTSKLETNTTSPKQQNGYTSGVGLNYSRYNNIYSYDILGWAKQMKNSSLIPAQTSIKTELKSADTLGSWVGQIWKGYFKAPVSGIYTFRGWAQQSFSLFLSKVHGSTQLPQNPLIYSSTAQASWDSFFYDNIATASASVQLIQNYSYYLQAYHLSYYTNGKYKISVEVPNNKSNLDYQVYPVTQIILNATVEPEVVSFNMVGGSNGTINLKVVRLDSKTLVVTYNRTVNITYGCSQTDFLNALYQFDCYQPYIPSVNRTMYDATGQNTSNLTKAVRIEYNVSLYLMRTTACQAQKFLITYYNYKGKLTYAQSVKHSPLINGSFGLKVNGNNLNKGNISYDVSVYTLQSYLSQIKGMENIIVDKITTLGCSYNCKWIISFKGYFDQLPQIEFNTAKLTGGSNPPKLYNNIVRIYSKNIVFQPIDYRFLYTASSLPNVMVSVNQIPAVCLTNCSYQFLKLFKIVSLSLNQSILYIQVTNLTALSNISLPPNLNINQLVIKADDISCSILANLSNLSAFSFACQLPTNYDGSAMLPAGQHQFKVYIPTVGYVGLGSGVLPITIDYVLSQLKVKNGTLNGGYSNSLYGSGFTKKNTTIDTLNDIQDYDDIEVKISLCGKPAHITFLSNKQIDFIIPACSTHSTYFLNVSFGSNSYTNLSFTYVAAAINLPAISSISPKTYNPMVKSTLNINGSNFGTNLSALKVYLTNSSGRVYELKVISVTNLSIKCGLPGGLPGNFKVQVNYPDSGDALSSQSANQFTYVSQIYNIFPRVGSFFGGTLLTIVGTNFSPASSDTLVYVGDTVNWFCKIQTINESVITCLTPPISSQYAVGEQLNIYVSTKLTYFSSCAGNCTFNYLNLTDSPLVSNISITYNSWGVVVIANGTQLTAVSGCTFRFRAQLTGLVTDLPALNCFNTTANITLPDTMAAGKYWVSILNTYGQGNPNELSLNWLAGTLVSSAGSTEGSYNFVSSGSFYPPGLDLNYRIEISSNFVLSEQARVIDCCSNNTIKLYFPPAPTGTAFTINFISPVGNSQLLYYIYSSSTPSFTIISPTNLTLSPGTVSFRLNTPANYSVNVTNITFQSTINSSDIVTVSGLSVNSTNANFSVNLPSGCYRIRVNSTVGYMYGTAIVNVTVNTITSTSQNMSFAGGIYTISGNLLSPSSYLDINGYKAYPVSYSSTSVTYKIPPFVTLSTQTQFNFAQAGLIDLSSYQAFSDQSASTIDWSAFDGSLNTYYNSGNTECWFGIDFGANFQANISRIRFFPKKDWPSANKLLNASLQGSNDKINWSNIVTTDSTVHTAWNSLLAKTNTPFRYIRFARNSTSACNIAQLQLYGIVFNVMAPSLTNTPSGMIYNDGYNKMNLSAFLNFRQYRTPIIQSLSQPYGDVFGGYNLTLYGSNLDFFNYISISIDNVPCSRQISNITQITCLVGARPNIQSQNSFTVTIDDNVAIIRAQFMYVLKWSDDRTWGIDLPPVKDDIVFVPAGMTLLVDQSTPKLAGIAVQNGTIIFANNTDITVNTGFITVVGGQFIAGTEQQPLYTNLTFILYGGYYDAQQPIGGNKMIFCLQCKFSMYGKPKKTWTTLATTVPAVYNVITVNEDVDWQIGDQIVVASTSFDSNQAEIRTIVKVNGRNVTVDTPFNYPHISVKQNFTSGDSINMFAEVGLLSRNIKIRGDPSSNVTKYGAHLMLYGQSTNGFEAKVAYSEFTLCGQPQIPGRYCIYFHNNGESFGSYAIGNSVYESYGRVVTIHAGHFIKVDGNVGYRAAGHNFYLEDGIQTNNLIQNNLAINSLSVNNMMQTDIMVASYFIRHPNNYLIGNRAAGSQFYGFVFDLPPYPVGSSASKDVCPQGSLLGAFDNNVAHSNRYHGLRVTNLYARKNPCAASKNEYLLNDLWSENPSLPTVMSNFTAFKNQQRGAVLQNTGNFILNNFTLAQNLIANIQFYVANFTKQLVTINNSVLIGRSASNTDINSNLYTKLQGLVTPRSGSINVTNVRFYSYPAGAQAFVTCSQCNDYRYYTNIGTQIFVQGLKFNAMSGKYLVMLGGKRDIIYDSDGSFSKYFDGVNRTNTTIVANYPHIYSDNPNHCFSPSNATFWDNSWLCDNSLIIRRIMFTNIIGANYYYSFYGSTMYVAAIQNQTISKNTISQASRTAVTSNNPSEPLIEKYQAWSLPFVAGTKYTVWFNNYDDFNHLSISATLLYKDYQPGMVFKFAYKTSRQLYSVGPRRGGTFPSNNLLKAPSNDYLQVNSCWNGDYYHNNEDSDLRMIQICQSGKNRTLYEYTQVNAIFCKYTCPAPTVSISSATCANKQSLVRRWSNPFHWPSGAIPKQGDNVTISCEWTMMLDVNPPAMQLFIVDGTLLVDDTFDINITARAIHIRSGTLNVGTNGSPFQHNFVIQINGYKQDAPYYVDPFFIANKFFVISGALSLNSPKPETQITYLTQTAKSGTSTLFVGSKSGWKVGDSISLSPSFSNSNEFQKVVISAINADGSISTSTPLKYTHYGSSSPTISKSYGSLDARTRVGHLTRKIKIVSGGDQSWGFTVYVYGYNDGVLRVGNGVFDGVQFVSGGQDSTRPCLQFLNLVSSIATSSVTGSSFHNCLHSCISVQNSKDISITSNVFYNIRGTGTNMGSTLGFIFEDNLIVGVVGSSGTAPASCFSSYNYIDLSQGSVSVRNNFCQGSQGYGFIIPHIGCDEIDSNPFAYNTAGSCNIGFIFNNIGKDCQASSYLSAYACNIGQLANPDTSTIKYSYFILADNKVAAVLKFGNSMNSEDNTAYLQNSYITALSRPNCAECYNATTCKGLTGIRMLTVTSNSKTVEDNLGLLYDIIDAEQLLDAKAYITNVTFDSYRQQYSPTINSNQVAISCGSNFVMRTNPYAVGMVGGHYLFNTICTNCDTSSYIYCDALSSQYLGLAGGCGDFLCTGKSNYIVIDWNGTFFGNVSTVVPDPVIGKNELGCTANSYMNGYLCDRSDFAVLQYESTAPDYNTRIMWPVSLSANNSNYTTVINGWREWNWDGSRPLLTRLGRFISIVKLHSIYNLTFTSTPPLQLKFKLQKRTPNGNNSYWTMVKLYYPLPNSIEVRVAGQTLPPIIITNTEGSGIKRQLNVSKCGDNIFYFTNKTIQFVVTQDPDCIVTISLSDSIQLTTHFAMNASDFFSSTVMSSFISNLCALLNIQDQSRVKVVGVYSGSAIIDVYISANGSAPAAPGADPNQQAIATTLSQAISSGSFASSMYSVVGYQVITASSSLSVLPDLSIKPQDNSANPANAINISDPKFLIGLIVGAVLVVFGVIVLMCYLYKKHMSAKEQIANNQDEKQINVQMKQQSHSIIMSEDMMFNNESTIASPVKQEPLKKQKRNRRVRQRQTLQIRQYD